METRERKREGERVHFAGNGAFLHELDAVVDPFVVESVEIVAVVAGELVGETVEKEIADEEVVDSGVVEELHLEENRVVLFALQLRRRRRS